MAQQQCVCVGSLRLSESGWCRLPPQGAPGHSLLHSDTEHCMLQVADMEQERGSLGVAEVGGLIYACGGGRGGQRSVNLDTVEVFTPEHNTWTWGPKMHEQRFTTSAAAINGTIYITGGFDGGAYLPTAERLDPRVGAWQPVYAASSLTVMSFC